MWSQNKITHREDKIEKEETNLQQMDYKQMMAKERLVPVYDNGVLLLHHWC
ncbi:hypothetical protein Hanom_Chr09g00795721 [Helianthus anomalus]